MKILHLLILFSIPYQVISQNIKEYFPLKELTYQFKKKTFNELGTKIDTILQKQHVVKKENIDAFYYINPNIKNNTIDLSYSIIPPGGFCFYKEQLLAGFNLESDSFNKKIKDDFQLIIDSNYSINTQKMIIDSSLSPYNMDFDTIIYKIVSFENFKTEKTEYENCLKLSIIRIIPKQEMLNMTITDYLGNSTNTLDRSELKTTLWLADGIGPVGIKVLYKNEKYGNEKLLYELINIF